MCSLLGERADCARDKSQLVASYTELLDCSTGEEGRAARRGGVAASNASRGREQYRRQLVQQTRCSFCCTMLAY